MTNARAHLIERKQRTKKDERKKSWRRKRTIFLCLKICVSCYLGLLRLLFQYLTMSFVLVCCQRECEMFLFNVSVFVSFLFCQCACVWMWVRECDCYSQMMSWQNYSTCWVNTKRVKQRERKNPKKGREKKQQITNSLPLLFIVIIVMIAKTIWWANVSFRFVHFAKCKISSSLA